MHFFPICFFQFPAITNYSMQGRTYRYADNNVFYPFGYGLSYSKYRYGAPYDPVSTMYMKSIPVGPIKRVMSEKTKEVPQLANATYAHTMVIKSTHE